MDKLSSMFRVDGNLYKICIYIYYLFVGNMLWIIFSLPVFTLGASTTALHYVMGKVARGEETVILNDFLHSFKINFKQSTRAWIIVLCAYILCITSMRNRGVYGGLAGVMQYVQFIIFVELVMTTIYVFPLLARYNIKIKDMLRTANYAANLHFITTIFCAAIFYVLVRLFFIFPQSILMNMSLYALYSSYMIERVLKKHVAEKAE